MGLADNLKNGRRMLSLHSDWWRCLIPGWNAVVRGQWSEAFMLILQCRPLSLGVFSVLCNFISCGEPPEHRRLRSKWMCIVSGMLCALRIPIEKSKEENVKLDSDQLGSRDLIPSIGLTMSGNHLSLLERQSAVPRNSMGNVLQDLLGS